MRFVEEGERAVDAEGLARCRCRRVTCERRVAIAPIALRRRMSRLTRATAKFVDGTPSASTSPVWMLRTPTLYAARASGQPPAAVDRDLAAPIEADAPAVEQRRRVAAEVAGAAEVEDALVLEEEVALLGEEQAEARQVDLLLVGLDLGEVGVVGEVGGQAPRDAVLHVEADVAAEGARDQRCARCRS